METPHDWRDGVITDTVALHRELGEHGLAELLMSTQLSNATHLDEILKFIGDRQSGEGLERYGRPRRGS